MSAARLNAVDEGLPRRLSMLKGDKHYTEGAGRLSDRIAVLLDGKELPEVASFDVDAGEVVRNQRYKDGSLVLEDGRPVLETLTGVVEVRWTKGAAA